MTSEATDEAIAAEADEAARRWFEETRDRVEQQTYRLALLQASYYSMRADLLRRQADCKGERNKVYWFYDCVFGALEVRCELSSPILSFCVCACVSTTVVMLGGDRSFGNVYA